MQDAPQPPTCYLGIDISKDHLDACRLAEGRKQTRRFNNTPAGHRRLVAWIDAPVRVCMEASGRYGLDLALALAEAGGVQVMVANPRAVKNFREASMRRLKTDALDADGPGRE